VGCLGVNKWVVGITGGSGYIGSSLARHFAKAFDVKLLDVRPPNHKLEGHAIFEMCDVRDYEDVKKSLEAVDLVIHAAIVQIPLINRQKRLAYEVNFLGTQNVCRAVDENTQTKGLILSGSWHALGERGLGGVIDEEFGFRPDKVEDRARLYALTKIAQESVVRFYDEMSEKIFGIIRMGTVLGKGMPEKTAANIFIENGLAGKPLTPYKHAMFRPMLYVDIDDVCRAYENFAGKIINDEIDKKRSSLAHIFNVYYPIPVTIIELAEMIKEAIIEFSKGKIRPEIAMTDTGQPCLFNEDYKKSITVDISKALKLLGLKKLKSSRESIEKIVELKIKSANLSGDISNNPI
jgi:nucleoside-diphosphate-sugar epimerase